MNEEQIDQIVDELMEIYDDTARDINFYVQNNQFESAAIAKQNVIKLINSLPTIFRCEDEEISKNYIKNNIKVFEQIIQHYNK